MTCVPLGLGGPQLTLVLHGAEYTGAGPFWRIMLMLPSNLASSHRHKTSTCTFATFAYHMIYPPQAARAAFQQ